METKNCTYCKSLIVKVKKQSRKQWEFQKFCSYSCRSKHTMENFKGERFTKEVRLKISISNTGKIRTEKYKVKMRKIKKDQGLKPRLGIKHTKETKEKISKAKKENPTKYWLGKRFPDEIRIKISESNKQNPSRYWLDKKRPEISGENSASWKGGITKDNQKIRHSLEYNQWRRSVFMRDNYTCIWCKVRGGKLEAHHIKTFALHKELRFDLNNGATLCNVCHNKTRWKEQEYEALFLTLLKTC